MSTPPAQAVTRRARIPQGKRPNKKTEPIRYAIVEAMRGRSKTELAARAGLARKSLSLYYHGHTQLGGVGLERLAVALGIRLTIESPDKV